MHLAATLTFLGAITWSASASAITSFLVTRDDDAPQPETRPKVSRLAFSGSGCTQAAQEADGGSVDIVDADYEHVTVRLRDFAARIGPGTNVTERTTNCRMTMQFVGAEPGWQVALRGAQFRGHLSITPPVTMSTWLISYFVEDAASTTTSRVSTDPGSASDGDVTTSLEIPESGSVWSLCSDRSGYTGLISVNYRVAFTTKEAPGRGSYGKTWKGAVTESLDFKWRRCE